MRVMEREKRKDWQARASQGTSSRGVLATPKTGQSVCKGRPAAEKTLSPPPRPLELLLCDPHFTVFKVPSEIKAGSQSVTPDAT